MLLVGSSWMKGLVQGGTSLSLAPSPASTSCRATERWFTPHCSVHGEFAIRKWTAQVPGPEPMHPIWPACWTDTPDRFFFLCYWGCSRCLECL